MSKVHMGDVPLVITRVTVSPAPLCMFPVHRRTQPVLAGWRVQKPVMDPPLPGPEFSYWCRPCLSDWLGRMQVDINIPDL